LWRRRAWSRSKWRCRWLGRAKRRTTCN
jgi:hypothetical protein